MDGLVLGLMLLGIMSKYGNQTHKAIQNKEKSGKLRMMHGRAADFIIVLGAIHAFLRIPLHFLNLDLIIVSSRNDPI